MKAKRKYASGCRGTVKKSSFRSRRVETQRPGSRKQRIGVGDTGANKFPPTYTFPFNPRLVDSLGPRF